MNGTTNASGYLGFPLPIPTGTWNAGFAFYFQAVYVDPGGPILGLASSSQGLKIRIGRS